MPLLPHRVRPGRRSTVWTIPARFFLWSLLLLSVNIKLNSLRTNLEVLSLSLSFSLNVNWPLTDYTYLLSHQHLEKNSLTKKWQIYLNVLTGDDTKNAISACVFEKPRRSYQIETSLMIYDYILHRFSHVHAKRKWKPFRPVWMTNDICQSFSLTLEKNWQCWI